MLTANLIARAKREEGLDWLPVLLRTPERDKHIVNVSAMEGQFYRNFKTTRHPHTNMAKAALNMLVRTFVAPGQRVIVQVAVSAGMVRRDV